MFNSGGKVIYEQVKIRKLAEGLFVLVNGKDIAFDVQIEEMSLSGNQLYQTMM